MSTPKNYNELIRMFGDLEKNLTPTNRATPTWDALMTTVKFPLPIPSSWNEKLLISRCTVHKMIAPIVEQVFKEIHESGYWNELKDFGGGYFVRKKRGSDKWSMHSWGIALDFNVQDNLMGQVPTMNPKIVEIFEKHGFTWGGRWAGKNCDGMHFEFTTGI
jgi:hypothetical protein